MSERIPNLDLSAAQKIEAPDLSEIEKFLSKDIRGQNEAVEFWASTIQRILSKSPKLGNGPLAVVTEIGPSGVGKTEIVKKVAQSLAGEDGGAHFIRVDCGEFQQEHEVAKILGAPPGYTGHGETPRLAQSEINKEAIQLKDGRKVTILLLDEIEKATPKLSTALLGALDYGKLTLGNNEVVDLSNCIVVFTSNLGNKEIKQAEADDTTLSTERKTKMRLDAMGGHFTPEQLSRMGGESGTIIFQELSRDIMADILLLKLTSLEKQYAQQGATVKINITEQGMEKLLDIGHSTSEGARRMEHVIEQEVIAKLSGLGEQINGMTVIVDRGENGIVLYGSKSSGEPPKVILPEATSIPTKEAQEIPRTKDKNNEFRENLEVIKYPVSVFNAYRRYIGRLTAMNFASRVMEEVKGKRGQEDPGYDFWVQKEDLERARNGEIPAYFFSNLWTFVLENPSKADDIYENLKTLFEKMADMLKKSISEKSKEKFDEEKYIDALLTGAIHQHPEALVAFFKQKFKIIVTSSGSTDHLADRVFDRIGKMGKKVFEAMGK